MTELVHGEYLCNKVVNSIKNIFEHNIGSNNRQLDGLPEFKVSINLFKSKITVLFAST